MKEKNIKLSFFLKLEKKLYCICKIGKVITDQI